MSEHVGLLALLDAIASDCFETDGWGEAGHDVQRAARRIEHLEAALREIERGKYDGLEVEHHSAAVCRAIARAALRSE